MAKVLTNGKLNIGAYMFPDRKKPCLVVEEGNVCVVYGHFNSIEGADEFMRILGKMVGAETDGERKDEIDFDYNAEDVTND